MRICLKTGKHLAGLVALKIRSFLVVFAVYRLSKLLLLWMTLDFISRELTMTIRRVPMETRLPFPRVSLETRKKLADAFLKAFHVIFTYYRLSRTLVIMLFTRHIIGQFKLITIMIRHDIQELYYYFNEGDNRWSQQLPEEIMQLILQRLGISDYLRCGVVCRSWRVTVDKATKSKCCCPAPELPWLMLRYHCYSLKDNCFLRVSDEEHQVYTSTNINPYVKGNYINRHECVGSIEGWLIMIDSDFLRPEGFVDPWSKLYYHDMKTYTTINFFLNPISGARVMLPSQSTIACQSSSLPHFLQKVVASSVPTNTQSSSSTCIVASLCWGGRLAFCKPTDKTWTLVKGEEARGLYFLDIEIIDGKLYAATSQASQFLMVFDIHDPPSYKVERLVMLQPGPVRSMHENDTRDGVVYINNAELTYLAKDPTSKELLMIFCKLNSFSIEEDPIIPYSFIGQNFVIPPLIEGFRVLKLDFCDKAPRWLEVADLGDKILFLSKASNKLIFVGGHNSAHYNKVERNSIYFAFDYLCLRTPSMARDFGMFFLENKSIKRFILPEDHSRAGLHTRTVWFTPNLW